MISTLLMLLVFVAVVYIVFWLVDIVGLPDPLGWIAKAIVALVALIYLAQQLGVSVPS